MTDPLRAVADTFATSRDRAHALCDGMPAAAFNWKPSPSRWSVAECLHHVDTVHARDLPVFAAAAAASPHRAAGPFRYGWPSRLFIRSVSPGARAMPTLPAMRPPPPPAPTRSALDRDALLAAFDATTEGFLALVARLDGVDLVRTRVASPFVPWLRLPLGAYVEALGQHALRHVGQAERVALERERLQAGA